MGTMEGTRGLSSVWPPKEAWVWLKIGGHDDKGHKHVGLCREQWPHVIATFEGNNSDEWPLRSQEKGLQMSEHHLRQRTPKETTGAYAPSRPARGLCSLETCQSGATAQMKPA